MVLGDAPNTAAAVVRVLFHTGMRIRQALGLRYEDDMTWEAGGRLLRQR
jgi:hypothetical protein